MIEKHKLLYRTGLGVNFVENLHKRSTVVGWSSDTLDIAHDLIHHINGLSAIGTVDDEIQALGSMYHLYNPSNTTKENIRKSLDLSLILKNQGNPYNPPKITDLPSLSKTFEKVSKEFIEENGNSDYSKEVVYLFKQGYLKSKILNKDRDLALVLFDKIKYHVETAIKDNYKEMCNFTLVIDREKCTVSVEDINV